ncbi:MAG: hypothetical protein COV29_03890 [Candidatus Yanofskybacteria bacterium CG10_big_fil_rev_8_21_14_0_10_36_16]|uniref:histidine kinase n=1 Tax=Candidatus Yanofskybacteria bacterium CG10_big_fil_rev_8_21_14_0_10_36_16 TaxID=1975096 RepID=A0A2J0Q6M8_9BACT|nr:MAG: hypothetical protein COV29_03890 [Candidatus Yanofskybacteria bacterium CG10_big_fil_rev_8_21_14_0_10_36_16]
MGNIIIIILGIFGLFVGFLSYLKSRELKTKLQTHISLDTAREEELSQRVFELSILKELGERVGYSLDVQKIVDVITGSLHQFIEYSAVSYMFLEPEKIVFKIHLEKSVDRKFIDNVRDRMLQSLSALMNKEFDKSQVEEFLSGAILVEDLKQPVRSFFNIPIVIANKVMGILTIAHTEIGLYKEKEMSMLYRIMQQASSAVTRLQEVVEIEQRKLNSMVESMTEGVIMTDKDYRILVANPAARSAVGLEQEKEVTIFDFIDKLGDKLDIKNKLEESIRLDKVLEVEELLINDKFFQVFVSPVKSKQGIEKGKILGGVVIFHDITNEKEVEKLREDFTSIMVHELRAPLDGIKKRAEVLKEGLGMAKDQAGKDEIMSVIYQNASHMLELVNDLLDVAKIEAGKFELRREPSNIKQIMKERVNFFKILAEDAKIDLSFQAAENVPDDLNFDPLRIEQVLNNLISNAIKFTDAGGRVVVQALIHQNGNNISEEAISSGIEWLIDPNDPKLKNYPDSLIVAVTDTGIGLSKENIIQLFNKFKQLQSSAKRKEKKGTGLGLVIAKGIVESHNGVIGVGSEEGKGSTFYFTIPIN